MSVRTVYTHIDYDGIASAAVFLSHFASEEIVFTTPKQLAFENPGIRDAVLDLPFARHCAWWFDHHEQNFDEPRFRGVEPSSIPGSRAMAPSCVRVILDYFGLQNIPIAPHFHELGESVDRFDSMLFDSLEEWLAETPGRVVNDSLEIPNERAPERHLYYGRLVHWLKNHALSDVAQIPEVVRRCAAHRRADAEGRKIFRKVGRFAAGDDEKRLLILDYTPLKYPPFADKKLAIIDHPYAMYTLAIFPVFEGQTKSNNISISLSRNFLRKGEPGVDLGDFFTSRDIGGGHKDAAGARIDCQSKKDRDREMSQLIRDFLASDRAVLAKTLCAR